jgi:tetratricopeptide (TPR) repeat protein
LPNAARISATRGKGDRGPSPAVAALIENARGAERLGQRVLARAHYEEALRTLASGDELPTATAILRWIAGTHFADANHAAAEDCVTAAIATAEAWSDDVAIGYAVNMLGMFRWQQGDLDQAVQLYNDARDHAIRTGDAKLAAVTAQNLGVIANIRGDFARALQFYQASLADYRAMGLQRDVCVALNNLGMVYTDTERWDDAELSYREAVELARDLGDVALRVQIEVNVVEMWVARGDMAPRWRRRGRRDGARLTDGRQHRSLATRIGSWASSRAKRRPDERRVDARARSGGGIGAAGHAAARRDVA